MLFSSPRFFIFLTALLVLLAPAYPTRSKKIVLAIASCVFYAAWDVRYLLLLLLQTVTSYFCGLLISEGGSRRQRRAWLLVSVCVHLGLLGYFKYADFFIENVNRAAQVMGFGMPLTALQVLLPAGVSFYTFKLLSYTIDVYRGELRPCRSPLDFVTFATFFPELIAGPIVRASVFLPQLGRRIAPTSDRLRAGLSLFLLGLTKKLLIADRVAPVVDAVFLAPGTYSTSTVWVGVLAYSIQIYCDFSGYSDMAIGTAKMLGYDLPENFNMPYLSANVAEFWRRWHMTLSFWLRDYLYIPLGGNRRGTLRTYVNLLATMAIGGLWHGASWNFVLWGCLHGLALVVHRLYCKIRGGGQGAPQWMRVVSTFLFVTMCWVPFRAANFGDTTLILERLVGMGPAGVNWMPTAFLAVVPLMMLGHVVGSLVVDGERHQVLRDRVMGWFGLEVFRSDVSGAYVMLGISPAPAAFVTASWILLVFFFSPSGTSPFIYFRF